MMGYPRKTLKTGFTIVELLIVVVVIGVLVSVVIVSYNGVTQAAKDKAVVSDAETVAAEISRYSTKNAGTLGDAVVWYSGGASNPNIPFTPSPGNVVDIVAGLKEYCIRVYNPGSKYKTLATAYTQGSSEDTCGDMAGSVAAGGTWSNNLAGWWRLNGNARDASGNSSEGQVIGATPTTGVDGQADTAYSFNGTGNYLNLRTSSTIGALTNNLTVNVWINTPAFPSAQAILAVERANSTNGIGISLLNTAVRFTTYGVKEYDASTITLSPNTWYMLTAVMGSNNTVSFYTNGTFRTSVTHGASGNTNLDDNILIGASTLPSSTVPGYFFQGKIDDLRVYKTALSASEITSLYAAGAQ
jgi:prepilin-type N-terminal cleavage/methylation domain-containing protein